jgi:hypothetical protein
MLTVRPVLSAIRKDGSFICSAGRIFAQHFTAAMWRRRGASSKGSFAPGDRRPAAGHFQFQGKKLIGVTPWRMGARQITVSFDDGFTSCTTSIIEGRTAGGHIVRKGENGGTYEILSSTMSSPVCSIQNGNAFAN